MVSTATATNTGAQSDQQLDGDDSDGMQSSQAESDEPSDQKVKGTDKDMLLEESSSTGRINVGIRASIEEGYSADCSSDQQLEGDSDKDMLLESSSSGSINVGASASGEEGYSADCSSDQQLYSDSDSGGDSDRMQSCHSGTEEPSGPKVTCSTDENVLLESSSTTGGVGIGKNASSGEGYRTDCSACSDQVSDQSFYCAGSGQKQNSNKTVTWNMLNLKYKSTEMESSSRHGGSSQGEKAMELDTILSSASKAKASSNTAKRNLSSSLKAKKNHEAAISASTAVAPGFSSSNKQNRRHHCSNHRRRRSRSSPHARDRAHITSNDLNVLLSDNSHKEPANTPIFVGTQALPQLEGVRFPHSMDPRRIYNSVVGHVQAPVPALATNAASLPATTTRRGSTDMKHAWRYRK